MLLRGRDKQAAWLRVAESGVVAIPGPVALSRWGLWQPRLGLNWAFFSPCCGIWGRGNSHPAGVARMGVVAGFALPRPPNSKRAEKNAQLASATDCLNPKSDNAETAEIATMPEAATQRQLFSPLRARVQIKSAN